jgi:hypothetical protein
MIRHTQTYTKNIMSILFIITSKFINLFLQWISISVTWNQPSKLIFPSMFRDLEVTLFIFEISSKLLIIISSFKMSSFKISKKTIVVSIRPFIIASSILFSKIIKKSRKLIFEFPKFQRVWEFGFQINVSWF